MKVLLVYVTAKDTAQARMIGKTVVQERLAACANIIDKMNSFYVWDGKLCDDTEAVLILKTSSARLARLTKRLKQLHSYANPCIVALPVAGGNKQFLDWVVAQTD